VAIIPNAEGSLITPSVVAVTDKGYWLIGEPARRQAVANPTNTVFSVKRLIGRKYDEVINEAKCLPYDVVKGRDDDAHVRIGGRNYSPPKIAALVLRKLSLDAEAYLGEAVRQAVITVPSHFNDSQRQAIKEAGRIAGLETLRVVNESTAACITYGLAKKKNERVAVVHFGGGTFDVSILEIGDGVFEVRSTTGDTRLGGDDIDRCVIEWLISKFKRKEGVDLTVDPVALQRLRDAVEDAKCSLSSSMRVEISLPYITKQKSYYQDMREVLTREQLERLVVPVMDRLREPVESALNDARLSSSEIRHVVLAGAMTRMPLFQTTIQELFDQEPYRNVHPEEVVALGAAIQGGVLTGELQGDPVLLDVTSYSLGIESLGGVMTKLIDRNTTIPTIKSQIFSTAEDNQPSVSIHILQGERQMAIDNHTLCRLELIGIPPAPRGLPQIEVKFNIDANGIIYVSASDKATGKSVNTRIESSCGLSEREIVKATKDIEIFTEQYRLEHPQRRSDDTHDESKAGSRDLGELKSEESSQYIRKICPSCQKKYEEWRNRCPNCGSEIAILAFNSQRDLNTYVESLEDQEEAARLDKNGAELFFEGNLIEAEKLFTKALQLNPKLATAHSNFGHIHQKRGWYAEAVPWLERALSLDPFLEEVSEALDFCRRAAQEKTEQPDKETIMRLEKQGIKFKRKYSDTRPGTSRLGSVECTYEKYESTSVEKAIEFLNQRGPISQNYYYVEVKTPKGWVGRDIDGIYNEWER